MFGRKKLKNNKSDTSIVKDNTRVNKFKSRYFHIFKKDSIAVKKKQKAQEIQAEAATKDKNQPVPKKIEIKKQDDNKPEIKPVTEKSVDKKKFVNEEEKDEKKRVKDVELKTLEPAISVKETPKVEKKAKTSNLDKKTQKESELKGNTSIAKDDNKEIDEKENALELMVVYEIERLLNDNRFELKKLDYEFYSIEKESDSLYEVEKTDEALEEIDELLERLKKIREKLSVIEEHYDFDEIFRLNDKYFTSLVDEYKASVKDQKTIEKKVSSLKKDEEYISVIKKILEFEKLEEEIQKLEDKKDELKERDEKFSNLKNQFTDVDKANELLKKILMDSEIDLKKITEKVAETANVIERTEIRFHFTLRAIANAFLVYSLLNRNPLHPANAMSAVNTLALFAMMQTLLVPQERRVIEYHYTDYHKMIEMAVKDTDTVLDLLKVGLSQISEMKELFEKEFLEYKDLLPEYKELFLSLSRVEKELLERQDNMEKIKNEMNEQLDKNDEKVLRYENLERNNDS